MKWKTFSVYVCLFTAPSSNLVNAVQAVLISSQTDRLLPRKNKRFSHHKVLVNKSMYSEKNFQNTLYIWEQTDKCKQLNRTGVSVYGSVMWVLFIKFVDWKFSQSPEIYLDFRSTRLSCVWGIVATRKRSSAIR